MNGETIKQEIRSNGLNAPRVTPADIEATIVSEHYFTADVEKRLVMAGGACLPAGVPIDQVTPESLRLLTFCVLVLRNGFTVTGESSCVSPENFDAVIGYKLARQKAIDKIWMLEGYALRERLSQQANCKESKPDVAHNAKVSGAGTASA